MPAAVMVGTSAFGGCTSLASVRLTNAETIGDNAFSGCPLTLVRFSDNLGTVSGNAFSVQFYAGDGSTLLDNTAEDLAGKCFLQTDGKLVDTAL